MRRNVFIILLIVIAVFGYFLRFWHYPDRFGLAYDQAHDAVVAREAIREMKIPLVGPFSSAGPFQTSGTWYWILMFGTAMHFSTLTAPWIFLTTLCGFLIIGLGLFGRKLERGYIFALLAALFCAISTACIAQSINLTNQTPLSICAFLTIVSSVWYMRRKTMLSAFCLGFFPSLGASIHLQGMSLAVPVLIAYLFGGNITIQNIAASMIGAFLPMSPILIWDMSNDYVNIRNMLYYYRVDQFNISLDVLGRRWLTYLTVFWPREWAHIIGGYPQVSIGIAVCSVVFFLYRLYKRELRKEWLYIFISFAGMSLVVRYTRVPLFSSFITFTHPFIILISAWAVYQVYLVKRIAGLLICFLIVILTMVKTAYEVFPVRENYAMKTSEAMYQLLKDTFPHDTFTILDWNYEESGKSLPLVLYLDEKKLLSDNGRKIGISRSPRPYTLQEDIISSASGYISDLNATTSAFLARDKWKFVNPSYIYRETEEWRE